MVEFSDPHFKVLWEEENFFLFIGVSATNIFEKSRILRYGLLIISCSDKNTSITLIYCWRTGDPSVYATFTHLNLPYPFGERSWSLVNPHCLQVTYRTDIHTGGTAGTVGTRYIRPWWCLIWYITHLIVNISNKH